MAIDDNAFVHASAQMYGKVTLCEHASVWPNTVIRAEMHEVIIGPQRDVTPAFAGVSVQFDQP